MQIVPKPSLSIRWHAVLQGTFTALVFVAVAALEWLGRRSANDVGDALNAFVMLAVVGTVLLWHRRRPLGWVGWIAARAARPFRKLRGAKKNHGIDFRGRPAYPERLPPKLWLFGIVLASLGAGAAAVWHYFPEAGWRGAIAPVCYTLYLALFAIQWLGLLSLLLAGLFLPVLRLDRHFRDTLADQDRRVLMFFAFLAYLVAVSLAAAALPVAIPLGTLVLAIPALVAASHFAGHEEISLLWRHPRTRIVSAIPLARFFAVLGVLGLLAAIALVLLGRNGRLITQPLRTDVFSLTSSLAGLAAWVAPGLALLGLWRYAESRKHDPAKRTPPTVHLANPLSIDAGRIAEKLLSGSGWLVRSGLEPPDQNDVRIELVPPEQSLAREFYASWPLKVSLADLDDPIVRDRLVRRDRIRQRRRLYSGLRQLMKHAVRSRGQRGGGLWFAPHWWFIPAMGRESGSKNPERASLRRIGPTFHDALGTRARQQLHAALRAAQVDVIFIEDGVGTKSLLRVMRELLELYDIHDGRKIADDHTFVGIPKVRVVIHEFVPDAEEWERPRYREAKFDELSRGRVMHIFRDKGESEEVGTVPMDFDYVPSPSLVG